MNHPLTTARIAYAGLLRAAEPPAPVIGAFVSHVGAVEAWDRIRMRSSPAAVTRAVAGRLQELDADVLQRRAIGDLEWAGDVGARLIIPDDPEWPSATMAAFDVLGDVATGLTAPLCLYARGRPLPESQQGAVTVVGSRASTGYGVRTAAEIATGVAESGRVVVSGAAFGIDAAAHRAALAVGGRYPTIAVLANGIDSSYPKANAAMVDEIARTGTVLCEYPPGFTPARHRFLVRNRIIAALGEIAVVVEAGARSGSISTANSARRLGRVVAAVPGPVTSALSVGCHQMIAGREAELVTNTADVLALLAGGPLPAAPEPAQQPSRVTDGLTSEQAWIYDALPSRGSRSVERIAGDAALLPLVAIGVLAELELMGLARRDGPYWRRRGG